MFEHLDITPIFRGEPMRIEWSSAYGALVVRFFGPIDPQDRKMTHADYWWYHDSELIWKLLRRPCGLWHV